MKKALIGLVAALLLVLGAGAGAAYAVTTLGPGQPPTIVNSTVCSHVSYSKFTFCHRKVTVKPTDNWPVEVRVGNWRCENYSQNGVRHTFCERVLR